MLSLQSIESVYSSDGERKNQLYGLKRTKKFAIIIQYIFKKLGEKNNERFGDVPRAACAV